MEETEGFIPILGYRLFYRSAGPSEARATILALHGGPGSSHDYLLPLRDLTRWGYRVVFFDQLACGRSEIPPGTDLFTLDHHVEETEGIRTALGLGRVHLVGSSYGGLLALAYAIKYQQHLRSLVTIGGLADVPFASAEMERLVHTLPPDDAEAIRLHGSRGELSNPDYVRATERFYRTFLCRLPRWPPELVRSLQLGEERPVYRYMNGPNEFTITGTIRGIRLVADLPRIRVPTLVTGGRYDEVTPAVAEQIHAGIPGSRRVTFEQSSHLPFWEERERFMSVLASFLEDVDRAGEAP
ncbi:MAG TPA: proline iminopeptidase-family hydrolase [Thermoplasmata archaeon]|nr:proline iminopeptidase-family hydrolase [Thermoplasmata archaeon]